MKNLILKKNFKAFAKWLSRWSLSLSNDFLKNASAEAAHAAEPRLSNIISMIICVIKEGPSDAYCRSRWDRRFDRFGILTPKLHQAQRLKRLLTALTKESLGDSIRNRSNLNFASFDVHINYTLFMGRFHGTCKTALFSYRPQFIVRASRS